MTLGTGIFLSTLVVSLVLLYKATADRWHWKKIVIRIALILTLCVILAIGIFLWNFGRLAYKNRVHIKTEFYGIKLSNNPSDILFLKGSPDDEYLQIVDTTSANILVLGDLNWVYKNEFGKNLLMLGFRDEKIRCISINAPNNNDDEPKIFGLGIGDRYEEIIDKIGQPSSISISSDNLKRLLCFERYNVFFICSKKQICSLGIYNKAFGKMEFGKDIPNDGIGKDYLEAINDLDKIN